MSDDLTAEEQATWDAWVAHIREDTVAKMVESSFVMSIVPSGETDIKFAVELGLAIMLDKPIIALAIQGVETPPGLRRIAHAVIEVDDIDTEVGQVELKRQLDRVMAELA